MQQYLDLLRAIQDRGVAKGDRTGTGTISLFGYQMRMDLSDGFPLLTTKKLPFRWIAEELLWMLSGSTYEPDLRDKGVNIWEAWATEEQCARFGREPGDLGPVYGHQWRNFGYYEVMSVRGPNSEPGMRIEVEGVDQIANAVDLLTNNPNSRRILVTGWNPREATQVALPPCHTLTQFYVANGKLSAQMYQRSADVFIGVPFNIASYALLTHMLAHATGLRPGEFIHTFGDVHIYLNHREQVEEQLKREPRALPKLDITSDAADFGGPLEHLLGIRYDDMKLTGYDPHPKIAAPVAV